MAQTFKIDAGSSSLAGLDRLSEHLRYHQNRQAVIATNLANIDTPGYRAKDLSFSETLETTFRDGETVNTLTFSETSITADDVAPDLDGNTVSLEQQTGKQSANLVRYQALAETLSRKIGMLRYAATDGQG